VVWLSGKASIGLNQHSYSAPGPVSAWMGDRLRMGKPPRRRTRHLDQLSLSHPSVPLQVGTMSTQQNFTGVSTCRAHDLLARIRGLAVLAGAWLSTS